MDRKVKHYDKPKHQRWLYHLSDMGLFKAIMLIWGICFVTIVLAVGTVKLLLAWIRH